jgi:carboxypeptidase PM20D1
MKTLKRIGLGAAILLLTLIAVLAFNTIRLRPEPLGKPPAPLPVDAAAVQRLSQALQIQTVSTEAATASPEALTGFRLFLERSFPRVHAQLKREEISGGSLLYTWQGADPSAPALLLTAHQDVVPVEAGSEDKWSAPPFSGAIANGFVIGRGAIDDKGSLMAILEATERLLARGYRPRQTIYLGFGHDEERGGAGAIAIAALLKQRGANVGLALDEGFAVLDGVIGGVNAPIAMIGVAEKGYASVELTATGSGGHSSMPSSDNAAVRISRAVERLAEHPFPARLDGPTAAMFDGIAPYSDGTMRLALANRWLLATLVKRQLLASPDTAAAIRTTTAPTIVSAGTKDNVLPQSARAVINHRILPGDTVESVLAYDRKVIDDPKVQARALQPAHDPSHPVSEGSTEYQRLASAIRASFPEAAVSPGLVLGATDGRHYEGLARAVLRFSPITMRKPDVMRFHGNDERIGIDDYMRSIDFYERLMSASPPSGNSAANPR